MSDAYYKEKAARRNRIFIISGLIIVSMVCLYFGFIGLFKDSCTGSYARSPEAVISSYVQHIGNGNMDMVINCWEHQTIYELDAGCSDICLSRIMGTNFQVQNIHIGDQVETKNGRANITAAITATCPGGSEEFLGEIRLDGVRLDVPWRHWKIIHSTFGGTSADPWCD